MCIQSIAPLPHTRFPLIDQKNGLLLKGGSFKISSWVRKVWVPLVNTFSSSVTTALPSLKFSFSSVEHAFPGLVFIPVLKYINKSSDTFCKQLQVQMSLFEIFDHGDNLQDGLHEIYIIVSSCHTFFDWGSL